MFRKIWHKLLHNNAIVYEMSFLMLAVIFHSLGICSGEGMQEVIAATAQGVWSMLLILVIIYAGMFCRYHNRKNVLIMAGRVLDKVICLLAIFEILHSDIEKGKVIACGVGLIGIWLITEIIDNWESKQEHLESEDLYDSRKEQLQQLLAHIQNNEDSETICISAFWGSGKSFFINKACEELQDYPIVMIQAMDMEDQEKLYRYVFSSIGELLESRGYYAGKSSEWQKYVASFGKVLFGINSLVEQTLSFSMGNTSNYRAQKEELSSIFKEAFRKQKLLIIVDDLERCDAEKAKVYLQFIKEIATFPRTMVIFLADYEKLLANGIVTQEASNKFITQVMTLREADSNEIRQELEKKYHIQIDSEVEYFENCFEKEKHLISMKEGFINTNRGDKKEDELKIKEEKESLETAYLFFQKSMANPRYYIAIARCMEERKSLIDTYLREEKEYLDRMMAMHQIFIVSWIQVVMSDAYTKMSETGIQQYVNNNLVEPKSRETRALSILTGEFWQRKDENYYNGFVSEQRYTFADHILQCTSLVKEDAVRYQSPDEKCILAAEQAEPLEGNYPGYVRICGILGYNNNVDTDTRNRLVRATLNQMKESLDRTEAIYEIISMMRETVGQIHKEPPITLYSDCCEVLQELNYLEVKGTSMYEEKLLTPENYYNRNITQWLPMRQYRNAITKGTDVNGPKLEWDDGEKTQLSIRALELEFQEASLILEEHQATKYSEIKGAIEICRVMLMQMKALYKMNRQVAQILENQRVCDDNILEKVNEELDRLKGLLNLKQLEGGRFTTEWDIPKIKEYTNYVEGMEREPVVEELAEKLNEMVSILVELDESRSYVELRTKLLTIQESFSRSSK